ncbi:hypothetical protein ETSB_1048 [cyanobacterium endosymbiont of Epithemia turgida isolate EtSB Lake Yunoko]|nr:hypothetical protein ETSB_1048 [cyanobacterium endosymbiont of Epithemia turgida isolate EtSB Lake Yunoko]
MTIGAIRKKQIFFADMQKQQLEINKDDYLLLQIT